MEELTYVVNGKIGTMKVNRPKAFNALNRAVIDEMDRIFDEIAKKQDIKVLVIGGDRNFAAGADITQMANANVEEAAVFSFNSTFNKLMNLPVATIAAMDGFALGGGLELALACDIRIATKRAKMGTPEITLGIMPGAGGTVRLPRLVGYSKAFEMICMGEQVRAEQALALGLVNRVVEDDALEAEVKAVANKLAAMPLVAMQTAKKSMRAELECSTVEEATELEVKNWASLFATEDQKEGMRAFLNKEKAVFKDR